MNLYECLQQIPDFRRREGRRYPLSMVLLLSIMSIICGHYRYREMATFCRSNHPDLVDLFGLNHERLPSHVTFRTILKTLDFTTLNERFFVWSQSVVSIESGDWLAIDGKALGSTLADYSQSYQNFVCLVSAFAHQRQQVLKVARFDNKKQSEIPVVQQLIETLNLQGAVLTLDALHCQKKPRNAFVKVATTT